MAGEYAEKRAAMVKRQLRRRGIGDERVLVAMGEVPREAFVREGERRRAYADEALPIGEEQTISQPWVVAAICQALALRGGERVLEVGTGSGYSAAVLARLAAEVVSVERHPELAEEARRRLAEQGVANATVAVGDGSLGVPGRAPFEAIAVHAASPEVPASLLEQLADGGRLVIPLARKGTDMLTILERHGEELTQTEVGPCRFVPLIGEEGYGPR